MTEDEYEKLSKIDKELHDLDDSYDFMLGDGEFFGTMEEFTDAYELD